VNGTPEAAGARRQSHAGGEPLRVLLLIDTLVAGGKERQLVELVKGLSARKDVRAVLVILSERIEYQEIRGWGVPVYTYPRAVERDMKVLARLLRLAREFRPHVIHSWELMCTVYAVPAKLLVGASLINGIVRNAPDRIPAFRKLWIRHHLTLPFSDIVLGNSQGGLRAYGVPPRKAACIYNGFDMERLEGLPPVTEVRDALGLHTPLIVGMVGNFSDKKDQKTLIEAARLILEKRKDVAFLFIGDGEMLDECRQLADGDEHFRFLGRRNDVEAIVNTFDVGVLSTFTEGISNSVMEYMALGKPVVASGGGGTGELVREGETGFLVPARDPDALAARIRQLLDDPVLRREMGLSGKRRIAGEFSLETMTDRFVSLYKSCADL